MVKIWEGKVVEWGDVEEVVEILDIHLEILDVHLEILDIHLEIIFSWKVIFFPLQGYYDQKGIPLKIGFNPPFGAFTGTLWHFFFCRK